MRIFAGSIRACLLSFVRIFVGLRIHVCCLRAFFVRAYFYCAFVLVVTRVFLILARMSCATGRAYVCLC